MAAFGLTLEDVAPAGIDLWPDTEPAVMAFIQMGTQWRVGMGGPIGLDYGPLPFVLRMNAVPRTEWPVVFEDVRVLENTALKVMSED